MKKSSRIGGKNEIKIRERKKATDWRRREEGTYRSKEREKRELDTERKTSKQKLRKRECKTGRYRNR